MGASRGQGFTDEKLEGFFNLLERDFPIGKLEWEQVARLNSEAFPGKETSVDYLKLLFASFHRKRIPTGDRSIPYDVKTAKRLSFSFMRGRMWGTLRTAKISVGTDVVGENGSTAVALSGEGEPQSEDRDEHLEENDECIEECNSAFTPVVYLDRTGSVVIEPETEAAANEH